MAVPTVTYESEIWATTRRRETKIETSEMEFTRSVPGYIMKSEIRNAKIREELNFFNINNNILKSDHNGTIACNEWETDRFRRKF